jgi:sulfur-oxidizing protein SoxX
VTLCGVGDLLKQIVTNMKLKSPSLGGENMRCCIVGIGAFCAVFSGLYVLSSSSFAEEEAKSRVEQGKAKTVEFCQACHQFAGTDHAGTVGPPLMAMKARFPDRERLRAIIYDPQEAIKPYTMMPPFGRHKLVTPEETELIIDFLYTL